jgi:hypothetical protein
MEIKNLAEQEWKPETGSSMNNKPMRYTLALS